MYRPINFTKRGDEQLDADVRYVFEVVATYTSTLKHARLPPVGLNFLEVGPGSDFAAQLILASMGANVTLADRFLTQFDPDYHPKLYSEVARRWDGPKEQLEAAIRGGHEATTLRLFAEQAEDLRSVQSGSIDLMFSNAVLEHVANMSLVAKEAARVTKQDGWGLHTIDWRNHRDFQRPLEHLIMDERKFWDIAESMAFDFGNRLRSMEYWAHFEAAGFRVIERKINTAADPAYLSEAIPRLRQSSSVYRNWPDADLTLVGGTFILRREDGICRERGRAMLSMIESLKVTTPVEIEEIPLEPALFLHSAGHCWNAPIPVKIDSNTEADPYRSDLCLLEDGQPLKPGYSTHATVRDQGHGAFTHWDERVWFSTSDNTSPVENGRRYSVQVPKSSIRGRNAGPAVDEETIGETEEIVLKRGKFTYDERFCWCVPFDLGIASDSENAPDISPLRLYEDGARLGPAHVTHAMVRQRGRGAYSHWDGVLWFSTSDNSSPRDNGRRYAVRIPRRTIGSRVRWLVNDCKLRLLRKVRSQL